MVKYCYPNLPNWIDAKTVDNYKPYYIAEKKKNGWRCLAWRKKEGLELWTRRNTLIKDPLPKTRDLLMNLPEGTIIDGELLDKRTKEIKDHYYAFDVLFHEGKSVMNLAWKDRREILEKIIAQYSIWVELAEPIQLGFSTLYDVAVEKGDEGIVIKGINSKYVVDLKSCPHNPSWFKAKRPEKCFVNKK
jgi:ATP-dependent DNA ligase